MVAMLRLSPRQIQALAALICGEDDRTPTDYRRMVDIEAFVRFSGVVGGLTPGTLSRWTYACMVIEHTQTAVEEGASGLSREAEKIIEALLDRREFARRTSGTKHSWPSTRFFRDSPLRRASRPTAQFKSPLPSRRGHRASLMSRYIRCSARLWRTQPWRRPAFTTRSLSGI